MFLHDVILKLSIFDITGAVPGSTCFVKLLVGKQVARIGFDCEKPGHLLKDLCQELLRTFITVE